MSAQKAIVLSPIAPLKVKPQFECELADEALYGMEVELLEEQNGWYKIRTPYRYVAWCDGKDLLQDPAMLTAWAAQKKHCVTKSFGDILAQPKVQAYPLITLPRGALVVLPQGEQDEDGWVKVRLADGREGYSRLSFFAPEKTNYNTADEATLRKALVDTAFSYLGTHYRWGGKTPQGIDCSGLCSMAYLLNGCVIYRDAAIKPDFDMHEIPYKDIQPGDLIFFKGHVAMCIGNGEIIHSTGHAGDDGVVINSLVEGGKRYRADLLDIMEYCGSIF